MNQTTLEAENLEMTAKLRDDNKTYLVGNIENNMKNIKEEIKAQQGQLAVAGPELGIKEEL